MTGEEASVTIPQVLDGWDPSTPVIMPKVQYMPEVVTTYAVYDKSAADPQDVHVVVKGYGQDLKSIKHDGQELDALKYEVRGNVYSIKSEYLAEQPDGRVKLTFEFADAEVELTIHVTGSPEIQYARTVLEPNDGWGSYGTGTIGGANAAPSQVHVVENRSQLHEGAERRRNLLSGSDRAVEASERRRNLLSGSDQAAEASERR